MAEALNDWFPKVIQAVEPWLSSEDIEKGTRWGDEISKNLEETKVGIACLTKDSLDSLWLHFEAGAIAKTKDAQLWTFLLDIKWGDVKGPLTAFQHTVPEEEDVQKLVVAVNNAVGRAGEKGIADAVLKETFDRWWPDLDEKLQEIVRSGPSEEPPKRDQQEMLEEILGNVRSLPSLLRTLQPAQPPAATVLQPDEAHIGLRAGRIAEFIESPLYESLLREAVDARLREYAAGKDVDFNIGSAGPDEP